MRIVVDSDSHYDLTDESLAGKTNLGVETISPFLLQGVSCAMDDVVSQNCPNVKLPILHVRPQFSYKFTHFLSQLAGLDLILGIGWYRPYKTNRTGDLGYDYFITFRVGSICL